MFFRGRAGQRLEPVREVRRAFFQRPFLHRMRHGIGDGCVQRLPFGYRVHQLFVDGFRETFFHSREMKDIAPETIRGERFQFFVCGFRPVQHRPDDPFTVTIHDSHSLLGCFYASHCSRFHANFIIFGFSASKLFFGLSTALSKTYKNVRFFQINHIFVT